MITFWRDNNTEGLRRICQGSLGQSMTEHLDLLARNAYIQGAYAMYTGHPTGDGYDCLTSADLFKLEDVMKLWLGLAYREIPMANNPLGGPDGTMIVVTTPGVVFDIQDQAGEEWRAINAYSEAGRSALLKYEVGQYKNARLLSTSKNTLWNAGTIGKQVTITSSTAPGVGAAATVDGVYSVGQGATAYVQCSAFDAGDFAVNDIVTIHTTRTSTFGVTNGVDWRDGFTCARRVVTVDAGNNRLSFDKPLLHDYTTDLGSGVYGYVTKGLHVHASVCMGGPDGVVCGVGQPPEVNQPPDVADLPGMYRFSWDAYMKYQSFRPEVFEVIFSAGHVRLKGDVTTG